jgi:NADPH-dependent curcumin reductase
MSEKTARRIVLNAPIRGVPQLRDFRLETFQLPELSEGQFLIRNVFCSVDPGTRSRLSPVVSYTTNLKAGEMISSFAMGWVSASKHPNYPKGTWVMHASGWTEFQISEGRGYLQKIDPKWIESGLEESAADSARSGAATSGAATSSSASFIKRAISLSAWIGVLGIPGMTAWFGMTRIGAVSEGSRILITSAAGPVGASAGQIARRLGASCVVGIAGGLEKCKWLKEQAHFDHAIDYKNVRASSSSESEFVAQMQVQLQTACPEGFDVMFDNVGNTMIDLAIPLLRPHARIVISGQVADYNRSADQMPGLFNTRHFIAKRLRMEGILVFDDLKQFGIAQEQIAGWIEQGQFAYKEELFEGIENMPEAFIGLFTGQSFGRRIVQVGPMKDLP